MGRYDDMYAYRGTSRVYRGDYLYGAAAPSRNSGAPAIDPEIGYIPGTRSNPDVSVLPSSIIGMMRLIAIVAVALAIICCARVALTAGSINVAIETSATNAQIEEARSVGDDLEVQQSRLANATIIRSQASRLGMAAPESTMVINLSDDVVVTDAQGNLSLSGSLTAIAAEG
ncbi:cell division protein FtsL [Slackia heliotrinireducens]|uniref:cell division protein FtsL n=1 Tax=Slackia heliotrinireducens TaxID=84110 RepID=UPI0033147C22